MKRIRQALYRDKLTPRTAFGLDTIQGLLEMADWYGPDHSFNLCQSEEDMKHPESLYTQLADLQRSGHLTVEWDRQTRSSGEALFVLKRVDLTLQGHLLLDDLKKRSKAGQLKSRFADLIWVIVTAILTTIITVRLVK